MDVHTCAKMINFVELQMVLSDRGETISCGNFHGEYPAKVKFAHWMFSAA